MMMLVAAKHPSLLGFRRSVICFCLRRRRITPLQSRTERWATGAVCPGHQRQEGPQGPSARGAWAPDQERFPQHIDKFTVFPLCFK